MAITSYITVEEAQDYFDAKLGTDAWDSSTDDEKLKALKNATVLINRLNFKGYKTISNQGNEFPRDGSSIVPQPILDATCELALVLLDGASVNQEMSNIAATSRGFSSVRTNYTRDFVLAHIAAGIPSAEAWQLLLPYLRDPREIRIQRVD